MAGQVQLLKNPRRGYRYTRSDSGITWGLSRASRKLAQLAEQGKVSSATVEQVMAQYSYLATRLAARGCRQISFDQGMSGRQIARLFRAVLYSQDATARLQRLGVSVSEIDATQEVLSVYDICDGMSSASYQQKRNIESELGKYATSGEKVLNFLAHPVTTAFTLIGLGGLGAFLSADLGLTAWFFNKEDATGLLRVIDAGLGLAVGGLIGALPHLTRDEITRNNLVFQLIKPTVDQLAAFAEAEEFSEASAQTTMQAVYALRQGPRLKYLSSLSYEKLQALKDGRSSDYEQSIRFDIWDVATARCQDVPMSVLEGLLSSGFAEVREIAINRLLISDHYTPAQLKLILFAEGTKTDVRRLVFSKLAADNNLTSAELSAQAEQLINIPELLGYSQSNLDIIFAATKASAKAESCQELLERAVSFLSADQIRAIHTELSALEKDHGNLTIFEQFVCPLKRTPIDVLETLATAAKQDSVANQAWDRIVTEGRVAEVDLGRIKSSIAGRVAINAAFLDPTSTVKELAKFLDGWLPISNEVYVGTWTDYDHYTSENGYCFSEPLDHDVHCRQRSKADLNQAKPWLALRPAAERPQIMAHLKQFDVDRYEAQEAYLARMRS